MRSPTKSGDGADIEAEDLDEVDTELTVPEYWMEDEEVEDANFAYSTRHPDDWVISGPLGSAGKGPGRRFPSWRAAEVWARGFYGRRLRGRVAEAATEDGNRWAFVIRGPRGSNG